ncbi:MAG TPA: histone deacetylase family protein, partial [Vineibacter sp.]|nr:histone deacetylase family protein [Vineibacter sp.]
MATLLFTHPACLAHDTGPGHPERPARLQAVIGALEGPDFAALRWCEAPLATTEDLLLAHPARHIEATLGAIPVDGLAMLDGDTLVSPGSREAALRAAGAVVAAVDAVVAG